MLAVVGTVVWKHDYSEGTYTDDSTGEIKPYGFTRVQLHSDFGEYMCKVNGVRPEALPDVGQQAQFAVDYVQGRSEGMLVLKCRPTNGRE
jgi:hypothetical protein